MKDTKVNKKTKARGGKSGGNKKIIIIIAVVALVAVGLVMGLYVYPNYLKKTTIGDVTLTGSYTTSVDFPENSEYIMRNTEFPFSVRTKYTDKKGAVAYKEIPLSKCKFESEQSDLFEVGENAITVSDTVLAGTTLDFTVSYEKKSQDYSYTVKYALETTVNESSVIIDQNAYDLLVNKTRSMSSDYVPSDLVVPNVEYQQWDSDVYPMRQEAATALEQLFQGAKEAGYTLYAVSGYRSYDIQDSLFSRLANSIGEAEANKDTARPGQSEHQTGLAMDITSASAGYSLSQDFGNTTEGQWVAENCYKYGFIIRYPSGKEDITGYVYEPWHVRYVGTSLAEALFTSGLTMEEWFAAE